MSMLIFKTPQDKEENKNLDQKFKLHLMQRLKDVRNSKKMTQQEVSEKAGLHLTYISHLELGKYRPTLFVAWKIANALGVSLDKLLG